VDEQSSSDAGQDDDVIKNETDQSGDDRLKEENGNSNGNGNGGNSQHGNKNKPDNGKPPKGDDN
jgi:hypothetical protein